MLRIAARLREHGVQPRLIVWREAPPKGDAADFVALHDGAALADLVESASPADAGPQVQDLLSRAASFVRQFVAFASDHQINAVVLWLAHAHTAEAWDATPYLAVTSPEKRAGKTRLLEVLELLVPRSWRVVQPSEAVLYRKIAADQPTLLLDEVDAIFRDKSATYEGLRALLNAGNRRGVTVPRCIGEGKVQQVKEFPVFCPKVLAGIGTLPETVADRSIPLRLARATPKQQAGLRSFRFREAASEAIPIRDGFTEWAASMIPTLRAARPEVPPQLDGRASDGWEPLLAIADLAGGEWEHTARAAAITLQEQNGDDSLRVRLLADIHRVFAERDCERLPTGELIAGLCRDETSPWEDLQGQRLTPRRLAWFLRPFGISPERFTSTTRGYRRSAFKDAWERYLPPAYAFEPTQPTQPAPDATFGLFSEVTQTDASVGLEGADNPLQMRPVSVVSVPSYGEGAEEPLFTHEDLLKGGGVGHALARVGEEMRWGPGSYAPGRTIVAGKIGWLTFIRANPVEELKRALVGLTALLDAGGAVPE
jgi:hypothetical protein